MSFRFLVAVVLSALVLAKPARRDLQVHESRPRAPAGFSSSGAASPDTTLNLRLALVRNDEAGLIQSLYDVSTPSSPNYGQHLTKEEVEAYAAPKAESVSAVNAWLNENGLEAVPISPAGDWLSISVPVSKANDLFDTEFSVFTHTASGQKSIRTLSYSIPTDLVGHLDLVHPTVTFSNPYGAKPVVHSPSHAKRSQSLLERADNCINDQGYMTPACLQTLYNIPSTPATSKGNGIAVTAYEYEWPTYSDLTTFLKDLRPDMDPNTQYTFVSIDNGTDPQNSTTAGVEASLDIQYTVGLATDVPVSFLSVGADVYSDDDFASALIDTASYMLNQSSPPQVISTSYGDDESYISQNLAYNLCNMLAQLGTRGVSVLYSSGDGGVSGNHWDDCSTFVPTFPSGCPYVTSIGGTTDIPEQAVNFSGGGFSNYWGRPDYQESAVSGYLTYLNGADDGLYNASGRGYPDVAVFGTQFEIVTDGEVFGVDGTSCSTPTFASVIGLLNDQLIAAGKSTLGWLNPWLYSTAASALNDITEGNNFACSNFTTGFNATTGWDPVTGLGTPDFTKLKTAAGL